MGLGDLDPEDAEEGEEQDPIVVQSEATDPTSTPEDTQGLIQPVDNLEEVAELYDQFERIKSELLSQSDIQSISGRDFITKSGWRKIATAFNLSVETVEDDSWVEDGVVHVKVKARAEAPNGKAATGVGICSSNESNFMDAGKPDKGQPQDHEDFIMVDGKWRELKSPKEVNRHNLQATAATRAKNRAISDCVGGGDVSYEEVKGKSKEDVFGE